MLKLYMCNYTKMEFNMNIFKPFPSFKTAQLNELDAIDILQRHNNIVLTSINRHSDTIDVSFYTLIETENDLLWLINLFGYNTIRLADVIGAFYEFRDEQKYEHGKMRQYLFDVVSKSECWDTDVYKLSLGVNSTIELNTKDDTPCISKEYLQQCNLHLKDGVLDKTYIFKNGTPSNQLSGYEIVLYQSNQYLKNILEPRRLYRLNYDLRFVV